MSKSQYTCTTEWLIGPEKTEFFTNIHSPFGTPKAVVIFVHGYIEHIRRYSDIFPLWAERGIAVVCYDQRGFGQTALNKEHNTNAGDRYGKTSTAQQLADAEFFVKWCKAKESWSGLPLFLMGHSMGGAIALGFATRGNLPPPAKETVEMLSGVIATSPLVLQSSPAPKLQRAIGGFASKLLPGSKVATPVKAADLTHDEKLNQAYIDDPLVIEHGTLKGVSDMLNHLKGENLLNSAYEKWPTDLPLLVLHGDEDKVCSHYAAEQFVKKVPAKDKTFTTYPGGYHELHNEPNGVRNKVVEECAAWVDQRAGSVRQPSAEAGPAKL